MKNFTYSELPKSYFDPAGKQGKVQRINYPTKKYGVKYAYIYTPYGYDGKDMSTRYDILYLIHGANSGVETFLWGENTNSHFKNMLDHMIENGEIKPLLVVTPTFYPPGSIAAGRGQEKKLAEEFPDELIHHLMFAVESMYLTYADSINYDGFRASRDHRFIGGFSMGGVITWYVFAQLMDCFQTYIPLSGDCWKLCRLGGEHMPEETAEWLADSVRNGSWTADDFKIYTASGTLDTAYFALKNQTDAMRKHSDVFKIECETADPAPDENNIKSRDDRNLFAFFAKGGVHDYVYAYEYLCSALRAIQR